MAQKPNWTAYFQTRHALRWHMGVASKYSIHSWLRAHSNNSSECIGEACSVGSCLPYINCNQLMLLGGSSMHLSVDGHMSSPYMYTQSMSMSMRL